MQQPKRVLNWRPSLPDHRDFKYAHMEMKVSFAVLPHSVDLRPFDSPIMDQGQIGSCSGNAAASAVEYLMLQENLISGLQPQEYVDKKFDRVSRLFIYWNERAIEGATASDAGATTLRDACDSLLNKGVCKESTWLYNDAHVLKCPHSSAYGEAWKHKIKAYYALDGSMFELKRCLANGFPWIFGTAVYESFMSQQTAVTGIVPYPSRNEMQEGGHALICVGYDDSRRVFIIKNSWGMDWGDRGYCYIPYEYMVGSGLTDDFYTIRREVTVTP